MTTKQESQRKIWTIIITNTNSLSKIASTFNSVASKTNNNITKQAWQIVDEKRAEGVILLQRDVRSTDQMFKLFEIDYDKEIIVKHGYSYQKCVEDMKEKTNTGRATEVEEVFNEKNPQLQKMYTQNLILKLIEEDGMRDPDEIRKKVPGGLTKMIYIRKLVAEQERIDQKEKKINASKTWIPPTPTNKYGLGWKRIMNWMVYILAKPEETLKKKKRGLWVYGKPNLGKTTMFLSPLCTALNGYPILKDSKFEASFDNYSKYDFMYMDEFKGEKSIQQINERCTFFEDGIRSREMYGHSIVKQFPVIIICSNLSIEDTYPLALDIEIEAIKSRFYEIEVDQPGNPFELEIKEKIIEDRNIDKAIMECDDEEDETDELIMEKNEEMNKDLAQIAIDNYMKKHPNAVLDIEHLKGLKGKEPLQKEIQIPETITEYKEEKEPVQTKLDGYAFSTDKFEIEVEDETPQEAEWKQELKRKRCLTPPRDLNMVEIVKRLNLPDISEEYKEELEEEVMRNVQNNRLKRQKVNQ